MKLGIPFLRAFALLACLIAPAWCDTNMTLSRPNAGAGPTPVNVYLYLADVFEVSGSDQAFNADLVLIALDGSNALQRSGVRGHFFGQSSFATHSLSTERNLVKVSKDLRLEFLAPLGCGVQTGAGTVMNSLKVSAGESIAIFGTGAVGIAAVMAARLDGAAPIVGVDLRPKRLQLALTLGATHVINNRRQDVARRIAEITGSGIDYVVETTGNPKMHQLAIDVLNPHGIVKIVGRFPYLIEIFFICLQNSLSAPVSGYHGYQFGFPLFSHYWRLLVLLINGQWSMPHYISM
jgi:hypothetical protein